MAGKSTSQESEQSLISVDGSEEDLFSSNWKSGVASVKTGRSASLDSLPENPMDVTDFEAVQMRSTSLSNEAAKHRISVKPKTKRVSKKVSMRKRERSPASPLLPDVKEESPTKSLSDQEHKDTNVPHKTVISTTIPVGPQADANVNVIPKSEPKDIPSHQEVTRRSHVRDMARSDPSVIPGSGCHSDHKSRPRSLSPLSTSPVSKSMLNDVKLRPRPTSGKFDGDDVKKEAASSENELAKAFNRAKRISKKFDEEGNVVEMNAKSSNKVQGKEKQAEETKPVLVASPVKDSPVSPVSGVSFVLKKEPLRPGNKTDSSRNSDNEPKELSKTSAPLPKATITDTPKSVIISTSSVETAKESKPVEKEVKVGVTEVSPKQGSPEKLASPREDYKLKRAVRSKTLPVSKDIMNKTEEPETKVMVTRSGSPPLGNVKRNDYENVEIGGKGPTFQSKRSSWAPASATTANAIAEPAWVVRARLKKMEPDKKVEVDKPDTAKEVKVEVKGASQSNSVKNEKAETVDKVANEQKSDIPKGTVQTGGVKTWAQNFSAKPFEKSLGSKPNIASVKPSVQSVKPPVTNMDQQSKASVSVNPSVSSNFVTSANSKPTATVSAKPNVTSVLKPTISSTVSKPNFSSPAKTSVSGAPKPTFSKPSVTASSKPAVSVTSASSADKPASSVSGTLSSDKPFSQSVKSTTAFGGVSSASSNFSRSFTAKSGTSVQKTVQDTKSAFQSSVKPVSIARADSKDSTNKSISISSINKTSNQDNKKADNDMKNASTATSSLKSSGSFDKSKPALSSVGGSKPETSSAVPAWKQALNQRKPATVSPSVKIEIIDKDAEKPAQKKVEEKPAPVQLRPEKCGNMSVNRPSKVLDMVKSFQNLQVT
ncbi:uncharacterized protein LOC132755886 isoform X2 [Ruditapes philippinarum]|nr:uncharacterized protein LOC132755886 isoform X2 [Ruditapes philippinarum]